jgi:hypothetical protein
MKSWKKLPVAVCRLDGTPFDKGATVEIVDDGLSHRTVVIRLVDNGYFGVAFVYELRPLTPFAAEMLEALTR